MIFLLTVSYNEFYDKCALYKTVMPAGNCIIYVRANKRDISRE